MGGGGGGGAVNSSLDRQSRGWAASRVGALRGWELGAALKSAGPGGKGLAVARGGGGGGHGGAPDGCCARNLLTCKSRGDIDQAIMVGPEVRRQESSRGPSKDFDRKKSIIWLFLY
jgi:hypothetical protein